MLRRVATGLIAGAIGTAVMDTSQTTLIPAVGAWIQSLRSEGGADGSGASEAGDEQSAQIAEQQLSSPAKVAKRGAEWLGIELDREQAEFWGNRVHWVYGIQWGVTYRLLRRQPGTISGLVFGAALWLASDELLLWALGIAKAPTQYPPKVHLDALAAHCVYGVVVGMTAKGLSRT